MHRERTRLWRDILLAGSVALGLSVTGCGKSEPGAPQTAQSTPAAPVPAETKPPAATSESTATVPAKPAAGAQARANPAPTESASPAPAPLADAKLGDWVVMENDHGGATRITVVAVTDTHVTLRFLITAPRRNRPVATTKRVAIEPMKGEFLGEETLEAVGRKFKCRVYRETTKKGDVQKTWISPDVPALGVVRSESIRDGKTVAASILTEFGRR